MFFFQLFRLATLAKGALALSLVAGAYGVGNSDVQEYRVRTNSAHVEATHEPTTSAEPTAKPEPKKIDPATAATTPSFEALLKECIARYSRAADNTKEACEAAMVASGLGADAFWAKYRSLLVPPAKTDKPATTPKPSTTDPAVKECLARYEALKTLKTGPADAFDAALRGFNETCRSRLTPSATKPRTTEPQKPVATPASSPKPSTTDPAVKECLARYETLKTLKTGPAETFESALHSFNETCRSLLTKPSTTEPQKPVTSPKPATTDPAVKECLAKYETLKTLKTGPAEAFEAALRAFNEKCRSLLVPSATKTDKPATTPKPASTVTKPLTTDPAVKECLARYEMLKTLKTGPAAAFEAALGAFNETCKRVLEARR